MGGLTPPGATEITNLWNVFQTAVLCFSSSALPPPTSSPPIPCPLETKMFLHLFENVYHVNEINHEIQNALILSLFKTELTMFKLY